MPTVQGFQYDLFISYAHLNNSPWLGRGDGWVTEFVRALNAALKELDRDFKIWFDPSLRTGEDFNDAIRKAISESAVFLSVLSPAYENSDYCKREGAEFREQRHPAFGMKVGSMSRMQGMVLEALPDDRWPPELRATSPFCFYDEQHPRFYPPREPDASDGYIKGLWKIRDSIFTVLQNMRRQIADGTAVPHSYDVSSSQLTGAPAVYLAEVPDDLYEESEKLRSALVNPPEFHVDSLPDSGVPSGPGVVSVHLFGVYAGRPAPGKPYHLSRLQLEAALAAKPARRPIVWLAPGLNPKDCKNESHRAFLQSLLDRNEIELLRIGFEDLKNEIQQRVRPPASPVVRPSRRTKADPIIHVWYQSDHIAELDALKRYLKGKCAISVFPCSSPPQLHSKLAVADGLIVPYTAATKGWAEDVIMTTFHLRRREEAPVAYAAIELPPAENGEFNFQHSRVFPIHTMADGEFPGIEKFLENLESADA